MESATLTVKGFLCRLSAQELELEAIKYRLACMAFRTEGCEYTPVLPTNMTRNLWIYLYLRFGIDSRWQRNAWMKICEKTQADLDRDNIVWLWEKAELKNM